MKRFVCALVALSLAAAACTGDQADQPQTESSPEPVAYKAIPRATPQKVRSSLTPKNVSSCLHKQPLDIASVAPYYTGPIDLTQGQVEETRSLDFALPSDIDMLEEKAFGNALKGVGSGRKTRDDDLVNNWLQWGLGYRPLGSDGSSLPPGNGADLVGGFYDPHTEDIVIQKDGKLDGEYVVLAHELTHAAADQAFGLKNGSIRLVDDKSLAYDAVVEGDASLVEMRFGSLLAKPKAVKKSVRKLIDSALNFSEERESGMPHAIIDQFVFPYRWGMTFVCKVYKARGWEGVNRLYENPPASTAEVMFPERYLKGQKPENPEPLGRLRKPWKLYGKGTIGPANLVSLFEAPGDAEEYGLTNALGRAAAWNGGEYQVWSQRDDDIDSVLGLSFVEHRKHKGVLCSSLMEWYETTYPLGKKEMIADRVVQFTEDTRVGVLSCQGRSVKLSIAPQAELARKTVGV